MKLIQKGNAKLNNAYMFNLPATQEVCGRTCKSCYAIGEQKRYPNVLPSRESRYEASLQLDFVNTIHNELSKLRNRPKYFRIHASGEFYDQAYINKWQSIVQRNPDIVFYAYTKRIKDFDFNTISALPNFVLINSFHYGGLNYGKLEKAPTTAFICPEHTKEVKCGSTCTYCMQKGKADAKGVWFVQH